MRENLATFRKMIFQMANEAGKIQMKYFRTNKIGVRIKGTYPDSGVELITKVDKMSERKIIEIIRKSGMSCKIISEESEEMNIGESEYSWVIDPIDGTRCYSIGSSDFCVALALLKSGKPIMGLMNFPAKNEIYFAEKGKGAFLNNMKLRISNNTDLKESRISFMSIPPNYNPKLVKHIFDELTNRVRLIFATTGGNFAFRDISTKEVDGAIHIFYKIPVWDFMPGYIIAKEAGTIITDFKGNEITQRTEDFVAGNKEIHKKLLEIVNS